MSWSHIKLELPTNHIAQYAPNQQATYINVDSVDKKILTSINKRLLSFSSSKKYLEQTIQNYDEVISNYGYEE